MILVESCLLGHGLLGVTDGQLLAEWPPSARIAVYHKGRLRALTLEAFLPLRGRTDAPRYPYSVVAANRPDGYITASGTVRAAELLEFSVAVSCGLGGICPQVRGEAVCEDITMLKTLKTTLVATAFKDMMDVSATFDYIRVHGGRVRFLRQAPAGYMLNIGPCPDPIEDDSPAALILNPIPAADRLTDETLLDRVVRAGLVAQAAGAAFHPAANAEFDRLTEGRSSQLQWRALRDNIIQAERLISDQGAIG